MARRRRSRPSPEPIEVVIEGLSHEGRGICHHHGKIVFVFGALPEERVRIQIQRSNRNFSEARVLEVLQASPQRIEPLCPHFGVCGGCSLQHLSATDQIELKQQNLLNMLDHVGIQAKQIAPPLRGSVWGYRRKARLGVKYVRKKGRLLIGFRERDTPYLADMQSCHILVEHVGMQLPRLMQLIEGLQAREHIAQIELAADDRNTQLVLRHLQPLSADDLQRLEEFARSSGLWLALQPDGPDSIHPLYPAEQTLYFNPLANGDLMIPFTASDFTQVNSQINQQMVSQALDWLNPVPEDRILDLFCGLGNFTLPLAQRSAWVTGVEVSETMVERARATAGRYALDNIEFLAADLTAIDPRAAWLQADYTRVLLDPPRSGALEVVKRLVERRPAEIVYVSCQPASLVRDLQQLQAGGYRLECLGLIDMFPQTAHVETMVLLRRS